MVNLNPSLMSVSALAKSIIQSEKHQLQQENNVLISVYVQGTENRKINDMYNRNAVFFTSPQECQSLKLDICYPSPLHFPNFLFP